MSSPEIEIVTSTKNPKVQFVKELLTKKTARDDSGLFVVEGVRLSEEAVSAGFLPDLVFYSETLSDRGKEIVDKISQKNNKIFKISSDVMNHLSDTETSQGLILVLQKNTIKIPSELDFVLIVDQLRDPGNLGTILRSSLAAGVQAVFATPGTIDSFSPKVVRAGMGAHFKLPIETHTWSDIRSICKTKSPQIRFLLAESGEGNSIWQTNLQNPIGIVIGGEANGASPEVKENIDNLVKIPMPGGSESLNAAIAASIILFEVVRQRQ